MTIPAPEPGDELEPAEAPAGPPPDPTVIGRVVAVAARVPFTAAYLTVALVAGVVTGALFSDIASLPFFTDVAYGLPAFESGRFVTLLLGPLFAVSPLVYAISLASFALFVGFAEWRIGTLRTLAVAVGVQLATVVVTFGLLFLIRDSGWAWAGIVGRESDVGFSAGALGALTVATATVPSPWRLRMRLAIVAFVLFSLVLVGQLADLVHLVAVLLALPLAARLAGPAAVPVRVPPARDELRRIAAVGLLVVAGSQVAVQVFPQRETPFGPAVHTQTTWLLVVAELVLWALIARGLLRGRPWAWWAACFIALAQVVLVGFVVLAARLAPDLGEAVDALGVPQLLASAALHVALLVALLAACRAYVPLGAVEPIAVAGEHPELARKLLKAHGGSSISWMTTWPRIRHMVSPDGESFIGFRLHAGVAIALGDPSGPPQAMAATFDDFLRRCDASNVVPFLFSCTRAGADVARSRGWRVVQIAEDNLIDLPALEFTGKKWQAVRTALNKAPKEGVSFRIGALADEPPEILAQVNAVSEEWLGEKKLPEMGFTLGGVSEALDRDVMTGLAVDEQGRVHGVTSWLPAYRPDGSVGGWTLDVMRRIEFEGNFRPTMEFLIASSALAFKERGAAYASLSGAPLARSTPVGAQDGPVEKVLDLIGAAMEPVYGFRSLHQFKAKFQPRLDPMYMAFRDEGDLPQIGIAITRAFLPDAGVGDFVEVAKSALAPPKSGA